MKDPKPAKNSAARAAMVAAARVADAATAVTTSATPAKCRRFDPRLVAALIFDHFDLHAALFGPTLVHAQQHFGPVLAFGTAGPGVDFDIAIIAIGLARQQRLDLVFICALGQRRQPGDGLIDHRLVTLHFGKFDQLGGVRHLLFNGAHRAHGLVQPPPLAHHLLRRLGVVPKRRVLHAVVQLVEPPQRALPVQETAHQRHRSLDTVNMILRFSAHVVCSKR
jgi:hypothetical protein